MVAPNNDSTAALLRQTLGIIANHNVRLFVGVEGPNDYEFLRRISQLLASTESDIPNLHEQERLGRLVFIPMGGSTLELWSNRLEGLEVPEIHLMDRDFEPPEPAKYQTAAEAVDARSGCRAFITSCREVENLLHPSVIDQEFGISIWSIRAFDDVPAMVAERVHDASGSPNAWATLFGQKRSKKISNAKRRLNRGAVERMTAAMLAQSDPSDEVRTWLRAMGAHFA